MNAVTAERVPAGASWYVGIPTDPRADPVRLTGDYASMAEASAARAGLQALFMDCEIFAVAP